MTKRSDTLAAQVAALDMVMRGIEEGRDMRAFVGGMLKAAKESRDAALEAEMDREDARLDISLADEDREYSDDYGPCADFAPDTLGDDPGVCTTCFYQGIDHQVAAIERNHEADPFRNAISVRAAYAWGLWPPRHE